MHLCGAVVSKPHLWTILMKWVCRLNDNTRLELLNVSFSPVVCVSRSFLNQAAVHSLLAMFERQFLTTWVGCLYNRASITKPFLRLQSWCRCNFTWRPGLTTAWTQNAQSFFRQHTPVGLILTDRPALAISDHIDLRLVN